MMELRKTVGFNEESGCLEWVVAKESKSFRTLTSMTEMTVMTEILADTFRLKRELKFLLEFAGLNEASESNVLLDEKEIENNAEFNRNRKLSTINPQLLAGFSQSSSVNNVKHFQEIVHQQQLQQQETIKLREEIKMEEETLKNLQQTNRGILQALYQFKIRTSTCEEAQKILGHLQYTGFHQNNKSEKPQNILQKNITY